MKLDERRQTLATASDIARFRPQIEEAAEFLVGELADKHPAIRENPVRMKNAVEAITKKISIELIGLFGFSYGEPKYESTEIDAEEIIAERLNRLAGLD
jgi:hypothetical protein